MIRAAIAAFLVLALTACATTGDAARAHPEARAYSVTADATADVDAALARASANGKRVLVVLGANWCHDSRALAGWLETPRFAALIAERYETVFVNVGMPQTGDGHNLDIARRFGLAEVPGTPAVLVLTAEGRAVNLDTAASWRNAGSRSEDAIFDELAALAALESENVLGGNDAIVWISSDKDSCRYALAQEGPWVSAVSDLTGIGQNSRIHVKPVEGTAWRCVASGMLGLQQFGLTVGFISATSR